MHTGVWVPPFIEQLTGISNRMLANAPAAAEVMAEVARRARGCAMVVHNISGFDRGFWQPAHALAGQGADVQEQPFACSLMLSRWLYPEAPNHRMGPLAQWHGITLTAARTGRWLMPRWLQAFGYASCATCRLVTLQRCRLVCSANGNGCRGRNLGER